MTDYTWEGMHPGTANGDRSYAKGMDRGRFYEAGYLITQLIQLQTDTDLPRGVNRGIDKAIELIEARVETLRSRNE